MSCCFERPKAGLADLGPGVSLGLQLEVDEQTIVRVTSRVAQLLTRDRHESFPLLAGALRDELLGPVPKRRNRGRGDESKLVTTCARGLSQDDAETHPGIILARHAA